MNEQTTQTLRHGSCTIVIHRPVLTCAERTKREQAARETLERVMRDYVREKETKT